LNTEERGDFLGNFNTNDKILVIYGEGSYALTTFELINRYEMDAISIVQKFDPSSVITAIYFDGKKTAYFVKRFHIETTSVGQRFMFISESKNSRLLLSTTVEFPGIEFKYEKGKLKEKVTEKIDLSDFIEVKGWKAKGNKLMYAKISGVKIIEMAPPPEKKAKVEVNGSAIEELTTKVQENGNGKKVATPKKLPSKANKITPAVAKETKQKAKEKSFKPGTKVELEVTPVKKRQPAKKVKGIQTATAKKVKGIQTATAKKGKKGKKTGQMDMF